MTTPRDKLDKRLGYSESLEAVTDVRKKMKKGGESPRSAQRHQLMHNGAIDGRKASDRSFKVPRQFNHKSTGRLVHRYPANTVRNTVDILNLPDFHNEQKFADYHSPSQRLGKTEQTDKNHISSIIQQANVKINVA